MNRLSLHLRYLLCGLLLLPGLACAEVYRHVDENGVVHYSDKPAPGARPADLPPLQVMPPLDVAPEEPPPTRRAAPKPGVRILTPQPDETFREADGRLFVAVSLDAPLPEGHGLRYLLDGQAQHAKPLQQQEFVFENVERGEHRVSVAVVDGSGREVARTPAVVVHMKPPTVLLSAPRSRPIAPK